MNGSLNLRRPRRLSWHETVRSDDVSKILKADIDLSNENGGRHKNRHISDARDRQILACKKIHLKAVLQIPWHAKLSFWAEVSIGVQN